ncbi:MAG: hypothetical protein HQL23_05495 [Candidatus Omnitrophica bacterium]|nr:hypothetical protein [Candidatus Omnitrophota bacterium]
MREILRRWQTSVFFRPAGNDLFLLSLLTVLITYQPFTLIGEINPFELGLYAPGIDAIFRGWVPYRDFFHLRGPLELYIPAFFMKLLGRHFFILPYYFYIGTVVTLLGCILIGKSLFRSRLIFYLSGLVIIARTFPRVYFNNWGGFRYAFGIFGLWCLLKYGQSGKSRWMFAAGGLAACGLLTSVEVGVCSLGAIAAMFAALFLARTGENKTALRALAACAGGFLLFAGSYMVYLLANGAWSPYIDSQFAVVTNMTNTFNDKLELVYPANAGEVLWGLTPFSRHFKHFTPVYTYLFFIGYLFYVYRQKRLTTQMTALAGIAAYGLIMYAAAWRKIENAQFEMALQPAKLLMFFLIERCCFYLWETRRGPALVRPSALLENFARAWIAPLVIAGLVFSSVGFAISKFQHRFVSYKMAVNFLTGKDPAKFSPLYHVPSQPPRIPGWEGVVLPQAQAEEYEQLADFFSRNTLPGETVFVFPENAFNSFVINRPFLSRFPTAILSWFKDGWHEELLGALLRQKPRYIVCPRNPVKGIEITYFGNPANRRKYEAVRQVIDRDYRIEQTTSLSYIYKLKSGS